MEYEEGGVHADSRDGGEVEEAGVVVSGVKVEAPRSAAIDGAGGAAGEAVDRGLDSLGAGEVGGRGA